MIEAIISVADKLLSWSGIIIKYRDEDRARIANYLEEISDCLERIVKGMDKRSHVYEHVVISACYELDRCSRRFQSVVGDVIEKKDADELSETLKRACWCPDFASSMLNLDEAGKRAALIELSEASGKFRAIANEVRAA